MKPPRIPSLALILLAAWSHSATAGAGPFRECAELLLQRTPLLHRVPEPALPEFMQIQQTLAQDVQKLEPKQTEELLIRYYYLWERSLRRRDRELHTNAPLTLAAQADLWRHAGYTVELTHTLHPTPAGGLEIRGLPNRMEQTPLAQTLRQLTQAGVTLIARAPDVPDSRYLDWGLAQAQMQPIRTLSLPAINFLLGWITPELAHEMEHFRGHQDLATGKLNRFSGVYFPLSTAEPLLFFDEWSAFFTSLKGVTDAFSEPGFPSSLAEHYRAQLLEEIDALLSELPTQLEALAKAISVLKNQKQPIEWVVSDSHSGDSPIGQWNAQIVIEELDPASASGPVAFLEFPVPSPSAKTKPHVLKRVEDLSRLGTLLYSRLGLLHESLENPALDPKKSLQSAFMELKALFKMKNARFRRRAP